MTTLHQSEVVEKRRELFAGKYLTLGHTAEPYGIEVLKAREVLAKAKDSLKTLLDIEKVINDASLTTKAA